MTRVIIVEDEWLAGKRLKEMLGALAPDFEVIQTLDSVAKSLKVLEDENTYDLLFMDIHLSDGDCFDVFRNMPVKKPIIFTTAYDAYAIQAFKMYAVDYLLKPIRKEELAAAIEKYRTLYPSQSDEVESALKTKSESHADPRWLIKSGQGLHLVPFEDVLYYFTAIKTTFLYTREGRKFPLEMTLEQIEKTMENQPYFRVNRQYIIAKDAIESMQTYSKSRVKILLKKSLEEVIVSVERSPAFKKWIAGV